jgi:hypothetical protein
VESAPRRLASSCAALTTVTNGTSINGSASSSSGTSGSEPMTPTEHARSSTGLITPPSAST